MTTRNAEGRSRTGAPPANRTAGRAPAGRRTRAVPRIALNRERIVVAALRLVEDAGLPAFTTRRLGSILGCEAMSIYHHFASKQHLLDAMVEHVIAGIPDPPIALDPIAGLRFLGREFRAMAYRHPRFFPFVALHRLDMPAGVVFIERLRNQFHAVLPDERLAAQAFRSFGYYVIGAALHETSGDAAERSAPRPVAADVALRGRPREAVAESDVERAFVESTFELGFDIMLNGIVGLRAKLPAEPRGAPKPVIHPKRYDHAQE